MNQRAQTVTIRPLDEGIRHIQYLACRGANHAWPTPQLPQAMEIRCSTIQYSLK